MKEILLSNGLKVIFKQRQGNLTSFCIGFNAGALVEDKRLGLAHAVEHMLFKGTHKRSEFEINSLCDEVFAFNNAMTNYPYAIYYGTTLSSEFEEGFELYSDIILNPVFRKEGFKEEMSIILEELKEWKDDPDQYCEDELLYNAFEKRRIKNLIIGTEYDINSITLEDIKEFYYRFYAPENCVISVISSNDFETVINLVNKYFSGWRNNFNQVNNIEYEINKGGVYVKEKKETSISRIQYCYNIDSLDDEEIEILKLFNFLFGQGTSSFLFDEIRTKNGLVYDISSTVKNETGIKLFTIQLGTSKENIERVLELINIKIDWIKNTPGILNTEKIKKAAKTLKLKNEFKSERSVELCKDLCTYEIMYGSWKKLYSEIEEINEEEIIKVVKKVLVNPTIQIIKS